jgi:hypothetical protein
MFSAMLLAVLDFFLFIFAFVGLVVSVRWSFARNWHMGYKALIFLVATLLGISMISSSISQAWGVDRGPLIALFSTGGIILFVNGAIQQVDWRLGTAAIVVGMALVAGAWSPYLRAGSFSFTAPQSQASASQAPVARPGPSIQNQPRRSIVPTEPTDAECDEFTYDQKIRFNCP